MAACSLTLLGGFNLRARDGADLPLSTRKDRLLLAYLALSHDRSFPRDRLAGLLWGDRGEAQARDSLRQSLAAIRSAFRQADLDPVVTDRESARLKADGIDIDVRAFEAASATDRETAAKLYRGELLDGLDGLTPEFEAWLLPERERLAGIAVRVLEGLSEKGSSAAGERLAQCLLSRDRLCEPAYRALMRLHVASGDRAAALKLYDVCRDVLKKELGVAPGLQTETLYRDILTERPASAKPLAAPDAPSDRPSIAVLPFENLSGTPDLDHLCTGIAEDITTGLGRFKLLFVIDRHSSATIARQTSDVAEIGRRLGVAHLVQGSLQKLSDRVRITVRLVDAMTRAQQWGEAYDISLVDILAVPDKATGAIVSTLQARVEMSLLNQARRKPKLAAYECVLRGVKHLRGYGVENNRRAVELFQQAVDLDPDYAIAWAYRAFGDVVLHGYADAPAEILNAAHALAASACDLDPDDARCHWIMSLVQTYRGDLRSAEQHCRRALALNPNDANAVVGYGRILGRIGQIDEGIDRIRDAMRLNPFHPDWYWVNLGSLLYMSRKYAEAGEAFRRVEHVDYWLRCRIAGCLAQEGRLDQAREAAAEALRLRPDFRIGNLALREWPRPQADHIREGLRKAGLPD